MNGLHLKTCHLPVPFDSDAEDSAAGSSAPAPPPISDDDFPSDSSQPVPVEGDDSSDSLNDSIPPLPPPMPPLHVSSNMFVQFPPQFTMCVSS